MLGPQNVRLCVGPCPCFCVFSGRRGAAHVGKIRERFTLMEGPFLFFADMRTLFIAVVCWMLGGTMSLAQSEAFPLTAGDSVVVISGAVSDESGRWIPSSMVVNRRSSAGEFVGSDREFLVRARLGDTLVFGAVGYHTMERLVATDARMDIRLKVLQVEVGTAEVIAPRTLREIVRDIQALGYREEDFRLSGVDAMQSPITFLYETFAREAQSRRLVAQLENDDQRRELLQELFTKYVDYDIVDLEPWEFDAFARFCDPGDAMLKQWSQYEFIQYVKQRYQVFRMMPRDLPAGDMEYHLDED